MHPSTLAPGRDPALATAALIVALACFCLGHPARAADEAPAAPPDTSVHIKAFPPSVQIDSTTQDDQAATKDDSEASPGEAKHHTRIRVDSDDEFDHFVQKMPWVIGLVFLVVGSIFLTPVILLIGIIWYKLRKTRLQNEAMLALAAKGVIPPSQAAEALASGASPASAAPTVYQQAVATRKHVIWSDLRKGVILAMLGAAFVLYSIIADGEASWIGLILLFVGVGYLALWWLEGRHLKQSTAGPGDPSSPTSGG